MLRIEHIAASMQIEEELGRELQNRLRSRVGLADSVRVLHHFVTMDGATETYNLLVAFQDPSGQPDSQQLVLMLNHGRSRPGMTVYDLYDCSKGETIARLTHDGSGLQLSGHPSASPQS